MRYESVSDLPKLGTREYIQGGTIFNGILTALDAALGEVWAAGATIPSFKLERESTANGRIVVADEACPDVVDPNAVLSLRTASGALSAYFLDEGRPFRREPYDEESFNLPERLGNDLSGEFRLPRPTDRTAFIKGVVGANKLLHQRWQRFEAPLEKIQFLYLKDLRCECLASLLGEVRLTITNLTTKVTEREVWTINRVVVAQSTSSCEFRLCYRARRAA